MPSPTHGWKLRRRYSRDPEDEACGLLAKFVLELPFGEAPRSERGHRTRPRRPTHTRTGPVLGGATEMREVV